MMTKEEAVARALCVADGRDPDFNYDPRGIRSKDDFRWCLYIPRARAAIKAADKWDAEQRVENQTPMYRLAMAQSQVSTGLDDALQAELDHPPASIVGKE
jgi:hypothetical protein